MALTPAEKQRAYRERRKAEEPPVVEVGGQAKLIALVDALWEERALNTTARMKLRAAILAG